MAGENLRRQDRKRIVARVEGVDPKKTWVAIRLACNKVRKMLGRDLTPQKITGRVLRVFFRG